MSLTAVPQPVGIFPAFFAQQPETIILKEQALSFSGDSFTVQTLSGTPVIQVQGNKWSWSQRKKVTDMQGKHLFTIRKKDWHMHTTFVIEDAQEAVLMEVRNSVKMFSTKATAKFVGHSGKEEHLQMRGNWSSSKAEITDESQGGMVIARIKRQYSMGTLIGKQTYGVEVAPGVDLALMAALCICLDEKTNEGAGTAGSGGGGAC